MSLAIEVSSVTKVYVAGEWHMVLGESFELDAYEYVDSAGALWSADARDLVTSMGFRFESEFAGWISGPITAIEAVRYKRFEAGEAEA